MQNVVNDILLVTNDSLFMLLIYTCIIIFMIKYLQPKKEEKKEEPAEKYRRAPTARLQRIRTKKAVYTSSYRSRAVGKRYYRSKV